MMNNTQIICLVVSILTFIAIAPLIWAVTTAIKSKKQKKQTLYVKEMRYLKKHYEGAWIYLSIFALFADLLGFIVSLALLLT